MEIVKLTSKSIDELHYIYEQQFKNEAWTKKQVLDAFNNNAVSFFGAIENNQIVSFICIMETIDDINILDIATLENFKNRGYAKSLLRYIISLRKQNQTVSLEVKAKNLPAINLYTLFGFETLNVRKKYYKDNDDALCMFLIGEN